MSDIFYAELSFVPMMQCSFLSGLGGIPRHTCVDRVFAKSIKEHSLRSWQAQGMTAQAPAQALHRLHTLVSEMKPPQDKHLLAIWAFNPNLSCGGLIEAAFMIFKDGGIWTLIKDSITAVCTIGCKRLLPLIWNQCFWGPCQSSSVIWIWIIRIQEADYSLQLWTSRAFLIFVCSLLILDTEVHDRKHDK